jgi:hypothetical protein
MSKVCQLFRSVNVILTSHETNFDGLDDLSVLRTEMATPNLACGNNDG